jgi:hypothetical protein
VLRAPEPCGLLFLAFAAGCTSAETSPASSQQAVHVKLERGPCLGRCPVYSVEIDGRGKVDYQGDQFVRVKGRRTDSIPPSSVAALLDKFCAADFWSLKPRYIAGVTDNPEYQITLTVGGQTKTVVDYVGGDAGMPMSVGELESEIDRIAGTERWVGHSQ